ncbi:hypothetical protein PIB30_097472, partial [Stylosanthes scabra]|nr:hypothetical protein [Stylosanthes scabra]
NRKRKGKTVATSSNQASPRFKTLYHEAHFQSMLSARRILSELILQADEDVFNPIRYQIYNRKWEKFTKPIQAVGHLMVKEFYANAWEPDKAKRKHPTYTSSVRGTEVSFAPSNIKRVLKLKSDPYPNAPSYEERKANKNYRLDHILEDMCEEDAQWVCHRDGRPHYLRRSDLEPMSKARQFKEMEMQGIPVTMANLTIHGQREEANKGKGKAREIVPDSEDSEDTFVSTIAWYITWYDSVYLPRSKGCEIRASKVDVRMDELGKCGDEFGNGNGRRVC